MTNLVQNLEQCWYISPPWGQRIPPLLVSLLERVYVKRVKAFGYCCGVEWSSQGWKYEINTCNDNITVWGSELIGTGNLRSLPQEKPVFRLGELVEFRFHGDGPPVRIVQGIQLINDSWFYSIEWMSPAISEKGGEVLTSKDSIARVTDYDLERVRL
ncbi:DUF1392 family protein [Nostoc flagelliforme FACHB-838]|uniref:DUF1392 family protein n=1 Tax=Nostoc flagelliforme FACHB-838 TaxID=2692904 RepID=A0ABR8E1I8_9NOSO|nr:DUF1392 family protein [Nostoc flagelliforme]MBD2535516.1 DUF1392 family protein [Nostoc flagelliforme FACHB-838]